MQTGGFAAEDYTVTDTCAFWGTAGCFAPSLRWLAFRLASLPCSSSEAERNWKEVKRNRTKDRNRIHTDKLEKMVFVRRFIHLKRKVCYDEIDDGFSEWVSQLLTRAARLEPDMARSDTDTDSSERPFNDSIEPGEMVRVNGTTPGPRQPDVRLTDLKKDHAARSWLFEKYYDIAFVDKNPEGDAGDDGLTDESAWEHRVIKDIVWERRMGWYVESALVGGVAHQSIERYQINHTLHDMIRDSPHNERPMLSQQSVDSDSDSHHTPVKPANTLDSDSDTSDDETLSALHDRIKEGKKGTSDTTGDTLFDTSTSTESEGSDGEGDVHTV
jgi:hypothetical protein